MAQWLEGVALGASIVLIYFGFRGMVQDAVNAAIKPLADSMEVLEHRLTDAMDQIPEDSQTEDLDGIEREFSREQIANIEESINAVQEQLSEIHEQLKDAQRQLYAIAAGVDNFILNAGRGPNS